MIAAGWSFLRQHCGYLVRYGVVIIDIQNLYCEKIRYTMSVL